MNYFVFDVESIGLFGEGFAVGWVIIRDGREAGYGRLACLARRASGPVDGHAWVRDNVPDLEPGCSSPENLRNVFWEVWRANSDCVMVADCPWPVEVRFLDACISDSPDRATHSPYPLIDVASVRLAVGLDPLATEGRLPSELPVHDPLADATQSARLLLEALARHQHRP
jgi:hypothetical protein